MKKKTKVVRKQTSAAKKHTSPIRTAKKASGLSLQRFYYFLGFTVIALAVASQVTYTQDFRGTSVLGDESSQNIQQQQQEQLQQQQEQQQHAAQQGAEQQNQVTQQNQVNVQNNESEVQLSNGVKVKTKVEDNGTQKIEAESTGVHFKFQNTNGETKIEAVNDIGEKVSTADAEVKRLEKSLQDKEIAVSSTDGVMEVEHNGIRARTNFPLSVDPTTNQLVVTTPAGKKTVAVLPDDAIKNMLANGFLTTIASGSANTSGATSSAAVAGAFQMAVHNGTIVYEIQGEKMQKLLGLFPVTTPRTVLVSAQTGQAVAQNQSWLSTLISFLSF